MPFMPMPTMSVEATWEQQADDFVVVQAAAGQITLPSPGYRLVKIQVTAAATPGAFQIIYDGISTANFPVGVNSITTSGTMAWALTWPVIGTVLPATLFAFQGGLANVTLTFSKGMSKGPTIDKYRSIVFTVTHAAAHATPTAFGAVNYTVAPAVPTGVIAFGTVVADVFYWPQIGSAQAAHASDYSPSSVSFGAAPPLPKATNLTPLYTNVTAAGTLTAYVGFDPA